MTPYTTSKNLYPGDCCTFIQTATGPKLIRAGRRTKAIAGVWVSAERKMILLPDGIKQFCSSPTGLQTYGPARMTLRKN